jgi:hypothetical protein
MLQQIVAQVEEANRLLEKAQRAGAVVRGLRSGDRVFTPLIASAEFEQGSTAAANLVFNVPADADFWAYRFLLYPYCKVIDPVNGTPDEVVFRPTSWTGQPFTPGVGLGVNDSSDFEVQVDAMFAFIKDGKELQNSNIPASAAYCVNIDKWAVVPGTASVGGWNACTQTPAGMVFDVPMFLPRTKTLTCRVTPTYLGIRTIVEAVTIAAVPTNIVRRHKYKIIGVLEGEKRPAAFR